MSTDVERLVVRLEATQRTFEKQMRQASRTATRNANNIETSFSNMNAKLQRQFERTARSALTMGVSVASALSAREIVQYADAWTVAENKIAAASQVSGRQARSLSDLNNIADETRSGITETADLYAKLLRATKDVAESEEEVARATEITNKAFKAGGAAASEQAAGILQLAQGLSSGILQGDELRSLRENAPLIAQAIADEFRTTIGGLKELGAEGKLTADRVFRAILNAQQPIEAAFAQTNATIGDGFQRLRNALTEYIGNGDDAIGITDKLAGALGFLAENLELATVAGVALGARFIGPVLISSLTKAIPALVASATALKGVSTGATLAASGLALVRGTLALFGGPLGLIITGLTAFQLYSGISSDKISELGSVSGRAIGVLDNYAAAVRQASKDQADLGGKVNATTASMLQQSRAGLQDTISELRAAQEDLLDDVRGVGVRNRNEVNPLRNNLATKVRITPELSDSSEFVGELDQMLADFLANGEGVTALNDLMQGLAGAGQEVHDVIDQIDLARLEPENVDLAGAREKMLQIAEAVGIFERELAAIDAASGIDETQQAFDALRDKMLQAAHVGDVLRGTAGTALREVTQQASLSEGQIEQLASALGATEEELEVIVEALRQAEQGAGGLASTSTQIDFSAATNSASALADQLQRAVGNAARLANQSLTSLQESQIRLDNRGDEVGTAGALAGARFDAGVGDVSGADPLLQEGLARQREEHVENAEAAARNTQALQAWQKAQQNAAQEARSAGKRDTNAAKDFLDRITEQTTSLNAQVDQLGLSKSAIAGLRAEQELLTFAREKNLDLDRRIASSGKTVREVIAEQRGEVERLTQEYERNEINQRALEKGIDGIADSLSEALLEGKSLREGFKGVLAGIAADIVNSGINDLITSLFSGGEGNTLLGGIGKLLGFADGGYTGPGGKYEPAGVVHKGEYVFDKASTSRIGVGRLAAIRNGNLPGFADGGYVGSPVRSDQLNVVPVGRQRSEVALSVFVDDDGKLAAIARDSGAQAGAASGAEVSVQIFQEGNRLAAKQQERLG